MGPLPHLYLIGPYGTRVSFASQQRRALNLVLALHIKKLWPINPRPKIAVIGGGIAGATVAAAAHLHDADVHIYEKEKKLLSTQENSSHRYIHPNINFWSEEQMCGTTDLPFLNWYESPCNSVLYTITQGWTYFEKKMSSINYFHELLPLDSGLLYDQGVKLKFEKYDPATNSKTIIEEKFDLAFITTGFGTERHLVPPQSDSYWSDDTINIGSERDSALCKTHVSGTGDGGIIDALRITYLGFMAKKIAQYIISKISTDGLSEKITQIEHGSQFFLIENELSHYYYLQYTKLAESLNLESK